MIETNYFKNTTVNIKLARVENKKTVRTKFNINIELLLSRIKFNFQPNRKADQKQKCTKGAEAASR